MATVFPGDTVIVLGGGLAGMSAANTAVELGARTVLLDKSAFCGGNSTKATSGINGAGTKTQKAQGIPDTAEIFLDDTMKGGAKKPAIAEILCRNSAADVDWLVDVFSLDLSLVARLGGHSQPRTHRGKERFPGMTITYALIQMLEKVAEKTDKARIVTKAEVFELITKNGDVIGCVYRKGGQEFKEFGPVVIATGGFGADFSQDSLLAKYRPDLTHLPTTNGEHCTGDGIKMSQRVGAKTIDLEWVQVHPTGLVNTKDPDAKVKFLAAEALRGVGGLVFDANGNRFCNELGRRDYVTGEMWKNKGPFRLVLNKAASDEIIWHCKHYTGRGVMKYFESGKDLAAEMGINVQKLVDAHDVHYAAAKKQEADPEGGPFPAYPSGKSWDKPSGDTGVGKKFFHNYIPGSQVPTEPFYAAFITPVIHYCMGGLEISPDAEVLNERTGQKINGLYAAGEVAGGVHGNNRLGGSSLLDCVVFGRVAGKAAAKYVLGSRETTVDLKAITGGGLSGAVASSKLAGGSYENNMNQAEDNSKGGKVVAPLAAGGAAAGGGGGGGLTMAEVAKHNTAADCWVVVNGQVLNVTSFLKDHPGGELAIVTFAGKDATEEFNMIHPPDVIGKYAPDCVLGPLGSGAGGAVGGAPLAAGGAAAGGGGGAGGYTLAEVGKHNTAADCWVVVNGQVLNVTSFLKDHPGGELAIVTFAGKDATEEFNMIHPPDVIGKYAPECVLGPLSSGVQAVPAAASDNLNAPLLNKVAPAGKPHLVRAPVQAEGEGQIGGYFGAIFYMAYNFLAEILLTIFGQKNLQITNDRTGLTRSAIFLIFFLVVHVVGNIHIFAGPNDFNGYGYFYVRLYWGVQANVVEIYVALCALLHVTVGLKRTWDITANYTLKSGKLNLAITGTVLLVFMIIHLCQFRFVQTSYWPVRPPPYLINWDLSDILRLRLFWTDDLNVPQVMVRDIYKAEFDLFASKLWCCLYIAFILFFLAHVTLGWEKLVPTPSFGIPKGQQSRVILLGKILFWLVALTYCSFPIYTHLATPVTVSGP